MIWKQDEYEKYCLKVRLEGKEPLTYEVWQVIFKLDGFNNREQWI